MPILSEPAPETFPGIADALPDALVVVDAAGCVRFANARAEDLFACPRQRLVGSPVDQLVPGLDEVTRRADDAVTGRRHELVAAMPRGSELPVVVWLAPLEGDAEPLLAVTIRDDSERRSLQEASARMRDDLFASVSHELRTPLTSIIGYTEVLVDMGEHAVSEQAARLLSIIERNAARELRLVEDLLTLAALGSHELAVQAAPTDLVPIVSEVLHGLAGQATEAGVQLRHAAPVAAWVHGDARRLEQVVRNLVGNAIKFTPAGGRVHVLVSADETHGGLTVEDQGVGVAPDELPLLFDGLYRGAHAVDAHLPGAGLGLPIVKGIVDAHGGHIDVQSARGEGTRVHVRIPLAGP